MPVLTPSAAGMVSPAPRFAESESPAQDAMADRDPGLGDVWRAASRRQSVTYNVVLGAQREALAGDFDPDYNPYEDMKGYEEFSEQLAGSVNATDMMLRKMNIDRQREAMKVLEGRWAPEAAAAVFDPLMLPIMFAGPAGGTMRAGAGVAATRYGGWAAAEATFSEAVLRSYQPTRSDMESLINVSSALVFGGLLGAGGSLLVNRRGAKPAPDAPAAPAPAMTRETRHQTTVALDDDIVGRVVFDAETGRPVNLDSTAAVNRILEDAEARLPGSEAVEKLRGERFSLLDTIATLRSEVETLTRKTMPKLRARRAELLGTEAASQAERASLRRAVAGVDSQIARINSEIDQSVARSIEAQARLDEVVSDLDNVTAKAAFDVANITEWRERGFGDDEILGALKLGTTPDRLPEVSPSLVSREGAEEVEAAMAKVDAEDTALEAATEASDSAGAQRASQALVRAEAGLEVVAAERRFIAPLTPLGRQMRSASRVATERFAKLVENAFRFTKNGEQVASPDAVETRLKRWTDGLAAGMKREGDKLFNEYRKRTLEAGEKPMKRADFHAEVSYAMLDGDRHAIPEVQRLAQSYRERVYTPLFKEGLEQRLFDDYIEAQIKGTVAAYNKAARAAKLKGADIEIDPADLEVLVTDVALQRGLDADVLLRLTGAEGTEAEGMVRELLIRPAKEFADNFGASKTSLGYMNRLYNREALIARRAEAVDVFTDWLLSRVPVRNSVVEREAREEAGKLVDDLAGHSKGVTSFFGEGLSEASPTLARTLMIPDKVLRQHGFLITDIERLSSAYIRGLAPRVELSRASVSVGQRGAWRWEDDIAEIDDDFRALRDEVTANPDLDEAAKTAALRDLNKQQKQMKTDFKAMIERMLGVYDMPDNPTHWVSRLPGWFKAEAYVTKMGGMALSSIPDMARPIMVHGLRNSYGLLLRNATDVPGLWKMNAQDLNEAGTMADMVLSTRMRQMADLDDAPPISRLEEMRENALHRFSILTGMSPWNTMQKGMAGFATQNRLLRLAQKVADGETIPEGDRAWMLGAGIDESMAKRIAGQPVNRDNDIWLGNVGEWTDNEAANIYRAALVKAVDTIIITKGMGDIPNWVRGPWMGLVFQFKSFAFAALNRMLPQLARSMSDRELRAYSGALAATALGGMVYTIKDIQYRGLDDSDVVGMWADAAGGDAGAAGQLLRGAVDHSGMLGALAEAGPILSGATGGMAAPSNLVSLATMGEPDDTALARGARSDLVDTLVGPTLGGTIPTASNVLRESLGGDFEGAVGPLRRLAPYQNVWWLRGVFDKGQEELEDVL